MEEDSKVLEQEADLTEDDLDAFGDWSDDSDDDWTEILTEAISDESNQDAQPEEDTEDNNEPKGETEGQKDQAGAGNQRFKINYLGNEEELTLEQITELAQKGRDYDHVRQERDRLKDGTGRQLEFLKKLAEKAGVSVEEQMDLTEAMWLVDEEAKKGNTISEAEALLKIQGNRKSKGSAEEKPAEKVTDVNPQVERFMKRFPKVLAEDIPQEVWKSLNDWDGDLVGAYQDYLLRQKETEVAKSKQAAQNNKNSKRSTGSLDSAGANKKRDAFDEGWDSDD